LKPIIAFRRVKLSRILQTRIAKNLLPGISFRKGSPEATFMAPAGQSGDFRSSELKYYHFGLALGCRNLFWNGFQLGPKKTIGKILQPINSYTRFPEYAFLGCHVEQHLRQLPSGARPQILDVGSPKCFSLYLAFHYDVDLHLTDIDEPTVEEAEILWNAVRTRAKGRAVFSVQDARASQFPSEEFDIVFSMSVIEHVEGPTGDSASMREMSRVLKPGGLLLVTVPFGPKYTEQERLGFRGAARVTGNQSRYFFQRIYTPVAAEERIIKAVPDATLRQAVSVWRKSNVVSKLYQRLGTSVHGLLGCFNPLLSTALNRSHPGIFPGPGEYGELHSPRDVYGDLMLAWKK
jgi:SAM-dependent methyltransferase